MAKTTGTDDAFQHLLGLVREVGLKGREAWDPLPTDDKVIVARALDRIDWLETIPLHTCVLSLTSERAELWRRVARTLQRSSRRRASRVAPADDQPDPVPSGPVWVTQEAWAALAPFCRINPLAVALIHSFLARLEKDNTVAVAPAKAARKAGRSIRAVQAALATLVEDNWVKPVTLGRGPDSVCVYALPLDRFRA